jgi:cysteine synthase B
MQLEELIGNTPVVALKRMPAAGSGRALVKLEGQNPAGSVKDRPALNMILAAERRGVIHAGDTLIEATSGNTGIALAMVATLRGYRMRLIMPDNMSLERRTTMSVYGAELVLVSREEGMERARDLALEMQARGEGHVLDQFANPDNPDAHYRTTGPEIWRQTEGKITHFVSAMGTTGTIMGVSRFLKEKNPGIRIIGVQPDADSQIPGIRRWPEAYLPKIYDATRVDGMVEVSQRDAEETSRRLAREEGLFCGISSGGAALVNLSIAAESSDHVVVSVVCDRGDRYLSTGVFGQPVA